jgi:hypothetical protein
VADLLADHLELLGGEALDLGVGERDGLDRDARLVEEQRAEAEARLRCVES